jgi:hypothetical protein
MCQMRTSAAHPEGRWNVLKTWDVKLERTEAAGSMVLRRERLERTEAAEFNTKPRSSRSQNGGLSV